MRNVIIKKNKKKIKLTVTTVNTSANLADKIITIHGPLGNINYNFKNQVIYNNKNFFIKEDNYNFFIKKLKKLIKSVTIGWFLELNLNGLGYKSFKLNDKIALDLGYSNLIIYKPTDSIKIKNFKNKIVLFSLDQEYLYNVSCHIKSYSMPDAYKGKGIVFKNEVIKLKKKAKS